MPGLYVQITVPTDGATISSRSETAFQAIAYDPAVGTTDGQGISRVEFTITQLSGGGFSYTSNEYQAEYCVFGGNGPCNTANTSIWSNMGPGSYELTATAFATGKPSVTVQVTFTKS
jgi:hypothetical protein